MKIRNPFERKRIRSVWNETDKKWYFAIIDIVRVFTDSPNPKEYIKRRKKDDIYLTQVWEKIIKPLTLETNKGKLILNCVNAQGVLMIIQSIASPKAVPLKIWLAKVATEEPERNNIYKLLIPRTKKLYDKKGYSPYKWIENRMQNIEIQKWIKKDKIRISAIEEQLEYAFLKGEISKATFNKRFSEYKKIKGFQYLNIQDIITDLDLIFRLLGEASTMEVVNNINEKEFKKN